MTSESKSPKTSSRARFVILRHQTPPEHPRGLHWDVMLEFGDALRTWAIGEEPAFDRPLSAEALPDHRREYLEYEGPISGGRGEVTRYDEGTFEVIEDSKDKVLVFMAGAKIFGELTLRRVRQGDWTATFCQGKSLSGWCFPRA